MAMKYIDGDKLDKRDKSQRRVKQGKGSRCRIADKATFDSNYDGIKWASSRSGKSHKG